MGRKTEIKILYCIFILQLQVFDAYQNPSQTTRNVSSADEDRVTTPNETVPNLEIDNTTQFVDESFQLDQNEALQKLREQIIFAKRTQHKIFAHDPEDILFMLTALILLCFHLFFMDMFIRLTRTRFQTNSRYQYLSTVHLFLAFLVCAIYFLLILLHYRDSQYCG